MKLPKYMGEFSNSDVKANVLSSALAELQIPETMIDEAKDWHVVKQKVGDIMLDRAKGRPIPYKGNKLIKRPNLNTLKMLRHGLFTGIYPSKLKDDKQKYKHLLENFLKNQFTYDIFYDLAEVLGFAKKARHFENPFGFV